MAATEAWTVDPGEVPDHVKVEPFRAHFGITCTRCDALIVVFFPLLRKDPAAISRIVRSHARCATKSS